MITLYISKRKKLIEIKHKLIQTRYNHITQTYVILKRRNLESILITANKTIRKKYNIHDRLIRDAMRITKIFNNGPSSRRRILNPFDRRLSIIAISARRGTVSQRNSDDKEGWVE